MSTAPQKDFPENETCVRHSGGAVQTTAFPMVKGDGGTLTISTRTTSLYQPYEQRIRPQRAVGTHTRGKQELLQCADGGEHEGVGGKADGQLRKRLHSCNAIIGCVSVSTENSHPSDISFFYMHIINNTYNYYIHIIFACLGLIVLGFWKQIYFHGSHCFPQHEEERHLSRKKYD